MSVLAWLNANQGAAMAALTAVYVFATLSMMRSMGRSNRLAQQSLAQSLALEQRRSRPYVVFDLDFNNEHSGIVHAVLSNMGRTAAYRVKVTVEPSLLVQWDSEPAHPTGLTALTMASLAPGHREVDFLATIPDFHTRYPDPRFTGEIVYEDASGERYREPICFDFNYRKEVAGITKHRVPEELRKLHDQLRELTRVVEKIAAKRT